MKKKFCILIDANTGADGKEMAEKLKKTMQRNEVRFVDADSVKNYERFFRSLEKNEQLVVAGSDTTLKRFANAASGIKRPRNICYCAFGTNCDFARDIGMKKLEKPRDITCYFQHLPKVTINGKTQYFINAVGFGADGAALSASAKMKANKQRNTCRRELIKNILFRSKPVNAEITVDGTKHDCKNVWLAPAMLGRFECDGFQPAVDQKRLNKDNMLSVAILHGSGRWRMAAAARALYRGKRIKNTEVLEVYRGKSISVVFDKPSTLHVDGEVIPAVYRFDVETA